MPEQEYIKLSYIIHRQQMTKRIVFGRVTET